MWRIRKTHRDRMKLINRLERKLAEKTQSKPLRSKDTLPKMSSQRNNSEFYLDYIEAGFNHDLKTL
jgi:hypothetical protein